MVMLVPRLAVVVALAADFASAAVAQETGNWSMRLFQPPPTDPVPESNDATQMESLSGASGNPPMTADAIRSAAGLASREVLDRLRQP